MTEIITFVNVHGIPPFQPTNLEESLAKQIVDAGMGNYVDVDGVQNQQKSLTSDIIEDELVKEEIKEVENAEKSTSKKPRVRPKTSTEKDSGDENKVEVEANSK